MCLAFPNSIQQRTEANIKELATLPHFSLCKHAMSFPYSLKQTYRLTFTASFSQFNVFQPKDIILNTSTVLQKLLNVLFVTGHLKALS